MIPWEAWTLERVSILFVALAFLLVGIQVTLFHTRQNFHKKVMWTPVLETPIFFLAGLLLTFNRADWVTGLFVVLMAIGTVSGLIGFYYHARGVKSRVGGFGFNNLLIGPPIVMPVVLSALSVYGLMIVYW